MYSCGDYENERIFSFCVFDAGVGSMTKTHLPKELQDEILNAIEPLNPCKVILFGSYAYGQPHKDSDIDILFINNEETYKNFEERIEMKMQLLKRLRNIDKPIDILAYTKKEWDELVAKNSSFVREINRQGVLLENDR
jgi:predicted nucleotidyltransferase